MKLLRRPLGIIRTHLRPYLALNAIAYSLLLAGMGITMLIPDLKTMQLDPFKFDADWTASVVDWASGSVWLFGLVILGVNVLPTALLQIALPSLIVPFLGIAIFAYRAFNFGVTLAPTIETLAYILIPHSLTLLIEFQAYILVMLGAYILGRSWIRPSTAGSLTRRQGYLAGLKQLGYLALFAVPLFIVGAFYESFEIIHLIPRILPN